MIPLPEVPFFIVGSPRSGTTLLRYILSSHPRIYVPGETGFLPFLPLKGTRELSLREVRQILDTIGRLNRNWNQMIKDPQAFYQGLAEPTLRHVVDALYRRKAVPYGAVRWGDKTPTYVRYVSVLGDMFPAAQFIHLIRDGRDTTVSAQAKWGEARWYMDTYYLLKTWVRNVEAGRRAGQCLGPGHYLEVRYEELVRQPREIIADICSFLKEDFDSTMLDHTALAREQIGESGHVEVKRPISTASVQRWRREMSAFEQKMARQVAGPTLTRFGYAVAGTGPLRPHERVRLLKLALKYRVVETVRRGLTAAGLLRLNRGKRR